MSFPRPRETPARPRGWLAARGVAMLGLVVMAAGSGLIYLPAGLIVLGVGLIAAGLFLVELR